MHGHLHRLFKWSVGRGIVGQNPVQDLPKPGSETQRDRVLDDAKLIKVWTACNELGDYGVALRLLVLTGARLGEISKLRWSEVDGDAIQLAGQRTKNGKPHIIPLSTPAQAALVVFPARESSCSAPAN